MITRRATIALIALLLLAGTRAAAAAESLSIAVGGANIVAYLPLTIANELGYFKEAGVDVTINDVQSGTKMAEALVGGSADIGFGSYEHVLHLRPKASTSSASC